MLVLQLVPILLNVQVVSLLHPVILAKQVHFVFGVKIQERVNLKELVVSLLTLVMIGVLHFQVALNVVKSLDVVGVTTFNNVPI
jgi:uncharacterized membrane protein